MKKFLLTGVAISFAAALSAGSALAELSVATVGPISGQLAALGEQYSQGAKKAVADINAAVAALREGHDAAFVPVADGGYGLIGLRRFDVRLFEGIAWSTSQVMAQTRARLGELGWTWLELPARWDVDEPADLDRLRADAALSHLLRDVA